LAKINIIGAGFSGLSAAAKLAQAGQEVVILEKHAMSGGRARKFESAGFTFDMGPSWYWMPEVFENFFQSFGRTTSDFYELKRLDPGYRVFYEGNTHLDVPASKKELYELFESIESGSSQALDKFLSEAQYKYEVGMNEFVWKPSLSIMEFLDFRIAKSALKLQMFSSISKQVRSMFKDSRLIKLLEFPVLFLGAKPQNTPALYSLMNYADLELGTWYPMGGMHKIIEAMQEICLDQGVKFEFEADVQQLEFKNNQVSSAKTSSKRYDADYFVSSADYEFTERILLGADRRNYNDTYWQGRAMAPSSLLFYIGLSEKLDGLKHHNLFFDEDFEQHAADIYDKAKYPDKPLFYACLPSKTDDSVAPEGQENLFILIPLAPGLEDIESKKSFYLDFVMEKLKQVTGINVKEKIIFQRNFSINDFISEYNAFKGNAYGLANTLKQTAILKPSIKNKHLTNFYYTGQLTTPGPGVPPSIISGQVVAKEIIKTIGSL